MILDEPGSGVDRPVAIGGARERVEPHPLAAARGDSAARERGDQVDAEDDQDRAEDDAGGEALDASQERECHEQDEDRAWWR